MRSLRLTLVGLSLISLAQVADAWQIPLELKEHMGKGGQRYVSGGVPLLKGQAKEITELRLAKKDGAKLVPVPAQFRVLARWWRADNSIRWVLADFQTDIKGNETQAFVLTNEKLRPPTPKQKLVVKETEDYILIATGPARFAISKKKFAFLSGAAVDANGDGRFSANEELLATTPDCGSVLEDAYGEKYFSSENVRSVEVIEKGALRVRVRARGLHKARDGKGYSKGMYSYDYFMDFYAGSSAVYCDLVIGNNFPKSVGSPTFDDASLWLKLKSGISEYSIAGQKAGPHSGQLTKGQSACLYQDSNGANTWQKAGGVARMTVSGWKPLKSPTSTFKGYKVWQRTGGKTEGQKEIAAGNQATGTTLVKTKQGGVVVHMRNFWQQFPKGVEVFEDGSLRIALFPKEYKVMHFLEDAGAKGHELVFHFYAKNPPDPKALAGQWDSKVLPRPDSKHTAACGALADTSPFSLPTKEGGLKTKPNNRTEANGSRMLSGDQLYGNAYGWQVFGERWRSNGGHSKHGARQPMNQDNYLNRWFLTGVHGWLLNGDARSRQFRDVRCYRIDDVDPFSHKKTWNSFRDNNRSEDWTHRAQPKDAEITKYQQGLYSRNTWWLPNPAHMTMDLPYERYLLMGDQRAFENLRIIAAHGGYYAAYRKPVIHRATGWSWRACFRYWELTGDKDAKVVLDDCIKNFKKMTDGKFKLAGKKNGINWWFTFVFSRAAAMTALETDSPDALAVCKRLADKVAEERVKNKGYAARDYAELHAVLYHLTGEEKYKKLVLESPADALTEAFPRMKRPSCAHWLINQPVKK